MGRGVERFVLFHPGKQIYHCGGFVDSDRRRAYLFPSLPFARQGLMQSIVDVGDKREWKIQRLLVEWDEFGDLVQAEVLEEI